MADRGENEVLAEGEEDKMNKCLNSATSTPTAKDAGFGACCNPEWDCAVCCELLYKPVVPPCGHPFCFWCAHRSMSYTSVSKCPLCRSEFTHLPRVSTLLHTLLSKSYPKQYEARAKETLEFEKEEEIQSMPATTRTRTATTTTTASEEDVDVDMASERGPAADVKGHRDQKRQKKTEEEEEVDGELAQTFFDSSESKDLFKCDHCGGQLFQPSIISPCSHCLCGLCSGMYVTEDEVGDSHGPIKCCPVEGCGSRLVAPPQTCHVLHHFLVQKFGHLDKQLKVRRVQEAQRWGARGPEQSKPVATVATTSESTGAELENSSGRVAGDGHGVANLNTVNMIPSGASGNENDPASHNQESHDSQNPQEAAPDDAGGDSGAMQVDDGSDPQERIIRALKAPCESSSPESFVHFGVGCDGCGVCPIVGPRYKCMECEEKIGFDLCAQCHLSHSGPGRFNQQHKPDHRMILVEGKETLLHSLLKDHPGFTAEYLMDLLNGMHP